MLQILSAFSMGAKIVKVRYENFPNFQNAREFWLLLACIHSLFIFDVTLIYNHNP